MCKTGLSIFACLANDISNEIKTSKKIIVGQDRLYDTLYPIGSNNNKHKPNLAVIDIIFVTKYEKVKNSSKKFI